jgi:predicted nucleic acid-binding protein
VPKKLKLKTDLIYWDSCCFLALLKEETEVIEFAGKSVTRYEACNNIAQLAAEGRVKIVTSAISLVEVLRIRKGEQAPDLKLESNERIQRFFLHDYIHVRDVRRSISEHARQLVWQHNLRPYDAVHVATCLDAKVKLLHTLDPDFSAVEAHGIVVTPPIFEPIEEYEDDSSNTGQLDAFSAVKAK